MIRLKHSAQTRVKTYTKINLKRIIDEPLECCQSANHEDSNRQPVPQTAESYLAVDPTNRLARTLASFTITVELGDHDIYYKT